MRNCEVCGIDFDVRSPAKRRAGGLSTHCPECSEETSVRYAGVQAGEGKGASVQILKFQSQDDREGYLDFWKNNSGLYKGKSCQMGLLKNTPNISFETRATFTFNPNHKGKA